MAICCVLFSGILIFNGQNEISKARLKISLQYSLQKTNKNSENVYQSIQKVNSNPFHFKSDTSPKKVLQRKNFREIIFPTQSPNITQQQQRRKQKQKLLSQFAVMDFKSHLNLCISLQIMRVLQCF